MVGRWSVCRSFLNLFCAPVVLGGRGRRGRKNETSPSLRERRDGAEAEPDGVVPQGLGHARTRNDEDGRRHLPKAGPRIHPPSPALGVTQQL